MPVRSEDVLAFYGCPAFARQLTTMRAWPCWVTITRLGDAMASSGSEHGAPDGRGRSGAWSIRFRCLLGRVTTAATQVETEVHLAAR